jgi:hypothetical protein
MTHSIDGRKEVSRERRVRRARGGSGDPVENLPGEHREKLLRIGAAGKLLIAEEIDEIVPLDDEGTYAAANPVKEDGTVVLDEAAIKLREKAIVGRLVAGEEPVTVIVLGVAHDLTDAFEGTGVGYSRTITSRVAELVGR